MVREVVRLDAENIVEVCAAASAPSSPPVFDGFDVDGGASVTCTPHTDAFAPGSLVPCTNKFLEVANGAVVVRDPSVDQVVFGLRSISRTTAWQLHSPAELAAVVRASTHHEFSRLGAANRAFAGACGPVLGELWSAEMILQFAGAYDDCVSGREATAGPSYRC